MKIPARTVLAAAGIIAASLIPAASASAASAPDDRVRELATRGAALVAQEQQLLATADQVDDQLAAIDAEAADVLAELDALGVTVDPAVRVAMAPLPAADVSMAPPTTVYGAAVSGLDRMAATPRAFVPGGLTDDGSSVSLLVVAAGALVALGLAARSRIREDDLDADLDDLDAEDGAFADVDGLTGVASRQRLERALAAAPSEPFEPIAVIMLGVDDRDAVAVSHGFQWGDDLLRDVGSALVDQLPDPDDVVYRYGGEQFCIVLRSATTADPMSVVDRILVATGGILLPDASPATVSIGVAAGAPCDLPTAIDAADRALYAARTGGHGHVRAADALQAA